MTKKLIGIEIKRLALKSLEPMPGNPQHMSDVQFKGLVKSMKAKGWLLDAPVCRLMSDGTYQTISGHHRIRAGIEAGILDTDCKVLKDIDDKTAKKLVLEANQRRGAFDDKELNAFINDIMAGTDIDIDDLYDDIGIIIEDKPEQPIIVGENIPEYLTFLVTDKERKYIEKILKQMTGENNTEKLLDLCRKVK